MGWHAAMLMGWQADMLMGWQADMLMGWQADMLMGWHAGMLMGWQAGMLMAGRSGVGQRRSRGLDGLLLCELMVCGWLAGCVGRLHRGLPCPPLRLLGVLKRGLLDRLSSRLWEGWDDRVGRGSGVG
jgi:hypothetical protein